MRAGQKRRRQNAELLLEQLNHLKQLQGQGIINHTAPEQRMLRQWQSERLRRTHADLLHNPRYKPAVEFFMEELYGNKDFSRRDSDMERAAPLLIRTMPANVLHTLAMGIELNVLSHELDAKLLKVLIQDVGIKEQLTETAYAQAYRLCDNHAQRARQIELIDSLGKDLDKAVHNPFVYAAVLMSKGPAHLAGFGQLHEFIESGFKAFRHMGGAQDFLQTIVGREQQILNRIYSGHPQPFQQFPL